MITEGTLAPPFRLPDHQGEVRTLADFTGRWLVLWWYPRACSEVCSVQGRALVPATGPLEELGAAVVGASFDPPTENARFAEQEGIEFPLLSDETKAVGTSYQVLRSPDERFADTPRRITYLIDPQGVVRRAYLVTDAAGHGDQLVADLRELTGATDQAGDR
ncbi:peroxiredoxin [Micromonospora sp. NPDC047074]|uniref:peroxiredoxin n=1 Tax=Micromonospora sp. NPDC047074 TaxID=3154339 RepID=UPI0034053500